MTSQSPSEALRKPLAAPGEPSGAFSRAFSRLLSTARAVVDTRQGPPEALAAAYAEHSEAVAALRRMLNDTSTLVLVPG